MFTQRVAQRLTAQFRALAQRRFASTGGPANEIPFVRERRHVREHAVGSTELWRKISIFAVPPALLLSGLNAYWLWNEHWEHWSHMPPLEERVEYPYQNIRVRNFSFGDGDKTLFWNEKVNYHNKDKTT
ncbi:cytochrome c oxidase [Podospora fimiseda]|uniref:Cytochrome c oxidase subunit 13, mitochondrial n=1 Tax=Podospora fimiseda TaxID=252190 RepID=A0AAN7BZJ7_9PEZI|nr:cytochrome c oxidase [Podospora fimiseda]